MIAEFRDLIGSSIRSLLQMKDLEEEVNRGNYLCMRFRIDISKPLSKARKIWLEGRVIGWAALKYECLPNFCYWYGLVTYDDRDCKCWLNSKDGDNIWMKKKYSSSSSAQQEVTVLNKTSPEFNVSNKESLHDSSMLIDFEEILKEIDKDLGLNFSSKAWLL